MICFKYTLRFITVALFSASSGLLAGGLDSILEPLDYKKTIPSSETVNYPEPQFVAPEVVSNLPLKERSEKLIKPAVEVKRTHLNSVDILKKLAKFLQTQHEMEGELKLYFLQDWAGSIVETEDYRVEFLEYPANGLASNFNVNFRIVADEKEIGNWTLPVRCELWSSVFYTGKRLARGSELNPEDLKVQIVDTLKKHQKALPSTVDVSEYELVTAVASGVPLLWKNVTSKPDVRKGQVVDILAEEKNMKLSIKGLALQNGLVNDFIKVRNLQSKREIEAQIINEKLVKVHF